MSINFDALPTQAPTSLAQKGWYNARIKSAEMKTSQAGNNYMNVALDCGFGTVFDIISESDKPLARYKLGQFIRALQLDLHGEFELKDLTKVVVGKNMKVAITITKGTNGYADRNTVDAFENGGYLPAEDNSDIPFDMGSDNPFGEGAETY